jgi:hypothetical protein
MSYSFRLRASGGSVQVESVTGPVPEGTFTVSGHENEQNASVAVTRFSVTGIQVAQASGQALKSFTATRETSDA